ncbi:MAG TPA: GNAT family protein [Candidatus Hydrogenedentes bacterium]|nr:MAG: hypothetical protein BWY09_00888 [Candidatus Hydrogenedentes bacterium ADurb.Bin179]HOH28276.1 GNAT family protein [Candidatus Hydrogenedentota bacterium]
MIIGTHNVLRFSEPEDAHFYRALYLQGGPKAALLDARREFGAPTLQEIRELLIKSESARAFLFTVEDPEGRLRGWCGLRALNIEASFCEMFMVFAAPEEYAGPMADETMEALLDRAFNRLGLQKVLATCLDSEETLHACLLRHGFRSCGVQRDVLYGKEGWRGLDTLALDRAAYASHPATGPGPGATVP